MSNKAMLNTAIAVINQRLETCEFNDLAKVCEVLSISIQDLADYEYKTAQNDRP